jgi:uncharacterized GH25 family protein
MSRMSLPTLLAGAVLIASPAAAHDFWIQPASFRLQPGGATSLTLQVGHADQRQRSPIRIGRITRFTATGPDGVEQDLKPRLHPGGAESDGDLELPGPGTYVLALQTDTRAESHLPADRYNPYIAAEGLTPAIEWRMRTGGTGADGSESYGRVAKALVQVGASDAGVQVTRPLGLPLEIVPEQSPYASPRPKSLPVRVYYDGRPLSGALVKLTDLDHDAAPLASQLTDSQGRASFAMPAKGCWLLNVVWTKPLPASSPTEFETVFSSLSFAVADRR